MSVEWTKEQQKVIRLRDRNILVSAAAGSGKTAVLVERIKSKLLDSSRPIDIDRLLIMTFTRAAAGEMKERITAALEQALYDDPDNMHLQRQMTLIHNAQITTIDGFCAYIIRNYFHMTNLDPGYRVAEEGELKLLQEDVMKDLLEEAYAAKDPDFLNFVECYATTKSDKKIQDMILKLYQLSMSNPFPEEWLANCLAPYKAESVQEMTESGWMKLVWEASIEEIDRALTFLRSGLELCREEDGPYMYEETLGNEEALWESLRLLVLEKDFDGVAALMKNQVFTALPAKKDNTVDKEKRTRAKICRDTEKKIWTDLKKEFFGLNMEETFRLLSGCRKPMEALVQLTLDFAERYAARKREKNLMDFTDMEHFALKILVKKDEEGLHPTEAARELSHKYEEVLVDEYQDSNYVQEMITTLVSGWADNRKNIFMVGDVKQSIYRFRLARPELFMEKYHNYSLEDSEEQRIDLHKNFRSRKEVLSSVNFIFRQIMGEDLGGITYDEDNALYAGAAFPEEECGDYKTEILLLEKNSSEEGNAVADQTGIEKEALAVAQRIRRMVGREKILDKKTGELRSVRYGDIAVLLRTASGWSETFGQVFDAKGIPAYTASRTGYFSAREVVTVLNYLRVCDNPCQDIPLTAVLHSPLVGCTAEELATVRVKYPDGTLCESVGAFLEEENTEEKLEALKEKLTLFWHQLKELRDLAAYTPIHELIIQLLNMTGYGDYVKALPGGAQRNANLLMLIEKASDYEKTSYRGLFNFVRYIEKLQKYEVDYGEVNLGDTEDGSVQIMTIHKSKGLEFPVVFVSGMGKQFNMTDTTVVPLLHADLGIGTDAVYPEKRQKIATPLRRAIGRQIKRESLGEELRVLYVALTRAKEKLIITGALRGLEKAIADASLYMQDTDDLLPIGLRANGTSFLDYLLPALARHPSLQPLFEEMGIFAEQNVLDNPENADFIIRRVTIAELIGDEMVDQTGDAIQKEILLNWNAEEVYNPEIRETLEKRFRFTYPYEYLRDMPVKVSVSELKKRAYAGEQEKEEALFYEPDIVPLIPKFIAGETEEYKGAARGTAYHRIMECLDYARVASEEEIAAQIEELVQKEKLSPEEAACTRAEDIQYFVNSELGQRIKAASLEKMLYREQPFVLSRSMKSVDKNWQGDETFLVQGIIDAFFEEAGELVLVDYKTDKVGVGEEQHLVDLYHTQLEDYAEALESLTKKKVKERYIYSFTLGKQIRL